MVPFESRSGGRRTRAARGGEEGNYSHNHLLAAQERVEDELASSQRDGGVVVSHLVDMNLYTEGGLAEGEICRGAVVTRAVVDEWRLEREGEISGASGL